VQPQSGLRSWVGSKPPALLQFSPSPQTPMPRLRLLLTYDGTPWLGWQGQHHGLGVQNQLETALAQIVHGPVQTQAAGRTDTGVHALGQVVHCDVELPLLPHQWQRALNDLLPQSIRVLDCTLAEQGFHARFSAQGKVYEYRIQRGQLLSPFLHDRVWHVPGELQVELLRECCAMLQGRHDFRRLSSQRKDVSIVRTDSAVTTRTLHEALVTAATADALTLRFTGQGFLYRMVRVMVGTVVHIARGRDSVESLRDMLQDPNGPRSCQCAPAAGLYLQQVLYEASESPTPASAALCGQGAAPHK
jgi:tRNA pseudouridine38-40 synthase